MNDELLILLLSPDQKRRLKLLENLLRGKKTVATLYWAMRYQLLDWLGVGKYFHCMSFDVRSLQKNGLVAVNEDQECLLTKKGVEVRTRITESLSADFAEALFQFQQIDLPKFKTRVQLFLQVVSEFAHQNRHYYVINSDGEDRQFIKRYFHQVDKNEIGSRLLDQLSEFLESISTNEADGFAMELAGTGRSGSTLAQIARELGLSIFQAEANDLISYAKLSEWLTDRPEELLTPLLSGIKKSPVSNSAKQTYLMFMETRDVNQVERHRRLKESTVLEHLLEVAIYDYKNVFPYDLLLSEREQMEIKKQFSGIAVDDWDYYLAPVSFRSEISFFKFRLFEIKRTKQELIKAKHDRD